MRRYIVVAGLIVAMALSMAGAVVSAQEPVQHGFVGTWWVSFVIDDRPVGHALTTITSDGIILTSNTTSTMVDWVEPARVVLQSLGHGAWVETGEASIDMTFVFVLSDLEGMDLGTRVIRGSLELGEGGDAWSGTYTATIADAAGNVTRVTEGHVHATRISVESMADDATPSVATPVA